MLPYTACDIDAHGRAVAPVLRGIAKEDLS